MSFKKWLGSTPKDKDGLLSVPGTTSRNGSVSGRSSVSSKATVSNENHLEATPSLQIAEVDESQEEDVHNSLSSSQAIPTATEDFPFGDGSDKIFGFENFGNTCYCNSIVQCLYYTSEFRLDILKYPLRDHSVPRERKRSVPGLKPHHATLVEIHEEKEDPVKQKISLSRRTSNFFGRNKRDSNEDEAESTPAPAPEPPVPAPQANNPNVTVITIPNIRVTPVRVVIGKTEDPNASVDGRKKAALITGPIINVDHSLSPEVKPTLFTALKDLFEAEAEHESRIGVVSPSYLVETLKRENELFRSAMHQDAHEFLNFLLNEVIDSMNAMGLKRNSIRELFEGFLTNQTKCLTCENITSRDEMFLDLSLDLTDGESLESCLKQFSAVEMLAGSNKFYCDNCHSLQEAEKKMGIRKLPKVLSLHLKRFKYSEEHRRLVKLFHKTTYPLYMRLESDIPAENKEDGIKFYELYAVVVHIGGGPHHGHYVALVKTHEMGWLLFDDETVEQIDESFVLRFVGDSPDLATAYVLFYQEISESTYDAKSSMAPSTPLSPKTSQPVMDGFNSDFNLNMKSVDLKPTNDIDGVSPLDKLAKVPSNNFSINSSQPSTVSSDKTKPDSSTQQRLKNKPSVASTAPTVSSSSTPATQGSVASLAQSEGKQGFWRRDKVSNDKGDIKDQKEKKKNRMSMSFNFKRA